MSGTSHLAEAGPERKQEAGRLVGRRSLGAGYLILTLEAPHLAARAEAGQFALVGVRPAGERLGDPLLLRPFSFLSRQPEAGTVELFVRVLGRGTALLAALPEGEAVTVVGPLGHPWPEPGAEDVALVAGGVGMPPLLDLAETWRRRGRGPRSVHVFYGGRGREHLHLLDRFEAAGVRVVTSTDDGSLGRPGTNVDALAEWLESGAVRPEIFACGPDAMMRAAAGVAAARDLRAWVSLEAPMACGIGVCRGCAVPHRDGGYRMVCSDGPVFRADEVYP